MDYANVVLALFAGLFSILSPSVLPLVPIVLGTAVSEHRLGPLALAAGLATSFTAIGLFVATIAYSVGLYGEFFRVTGAILLAAAGFALMLPRLQIQSALAAAPLGSWTQQKFGSTATAGLRGQFGVGLLLGAVWSPCVGPTLGAASVLAAQDQSLGLVALTMLFFGFGAVPFGDSVRPDSPRNDDARAASPSLDRHKWQDNSGRHSDCQRTCSPRPSPTLTFAPGVSHQPRRVGTADAGRSAEVEGFSGRVWRFRRGNRRIGRFPIALDRQRR